MALTKISDVFQLPETLKEIELSVSDLNSSVLTIAGDVQELELSVSQLSASVTEIALDVSQLSASVLTIAGDVEDIKDKLTVEDKTITLNPTYFNVEDTDNNVICEKYGKLVILTITGLKLLTDIVDGTPLLISGLPLPKNENNYVIFGRVTGSGMQEAFRVRILSTGELKYWYNNNNLPTTKIINGQIIYLTN